jgi:predicted MFS family arabinose efflux permease
VLIPVIGGAMLLAGFTAWATRRAAAALVDVRLFAVRSVRASSVTLVFLGAALYAGSFLLPLYFQAFRGYSVLETALLLIPQGVGTLLARFVVGRLVDRFGSRLVAVAGFLVIAAATVPFALAGADTDLWLMGAVLFVRGFGLGIVTIPVMTVAYIDIRKDQMPHASAITRIVQQLGAAFGTAVVAVILTAATSETNLAAGFDTALWVTIVMTIAAAISALLLPTRARVQEPVRQTTDEHEDRIISSREAA